jgi:phosphatidate phosphatase APP1
LLEEPKVVPGMPELYATLAQSLPTPQFVYITATPYQFYPFLNSFIDSTFSASKGPIFTQNLTVVDIPEVIKFITDDGVDPLAYKLSMIDRVQAMYPNKKWVAIGDSTQKDPEVYAAAYVAISCFMCEGQC